MRIFIEMSFMRKLLLLLIMAGFSLSAQAQSQLPNNMTASEKAQMASYLNAVPVTSSAITSPPSSPVRTMAEWEEIDGLMITWTSYPAIQKELVRAARLETMVYIVCSDSDAVKTYLQSGTNPVSLSNINYLVRPFNSVWARDYGQWNVYTDEVDSLLLVDWIYNRPRPKDDTIPAGIASMLSLPLYTTTQAPNDLVHTGGNFMVDGFGTGFSSDLILMENSSKTEADIDTIMSKFMGLHRYIKMDTLPYDDIHHIDMHMKLLDEETLLVGQFPQGQSDGPQIEANLLYVLNNYNSHFGTAYKIVRIPMPPSTTGIFPPSSFYRTYTNSVIVNKTVIVPTYREEYDTTALRIYREAMPGYNIVGVNVEGMISASGALHCITKEIGAKDQLLISHQELQDAYYAGPFPVNAYIRHRSGIASATLYYTTDTMQPYTAVPMSAGTQANIWTGNIPPQPYGTRIFYYVHAQSVSGKQQNRPMPAPDAYWTFRVLYNASVPGMETVAQLQVKDIFPNPSKGITCIPLVSDIYTNATMYVSDVMGRKVADIHSGKIPSGESYYFFNSSDWSAGMYFVTIKAGSETITRRVVVR
jgi:agmatine deiminase